MCRQKKYFRVEKEIEKWKSKALTGDQRHIGEAAFVGYLLGYSHQYVSSDVSRAISSYNQEEI